MDSRMTDFGGSGQIRTVVARLKRTALSRLSYAPKPAPGSRIELSWSDPQSPASATRPRSHLAPGARVERACPAFRTGALTATASLANLVEEEGIEPSLAGCRPAVLPLNDSPQNWLRAGELNATRVAYEASMTPVHLPA